MRQVYDTPDGLEVAFDLGSGDIEVDVRDTATTTVEITGYENESPPTVRCEPAPGGGHRLKVEYKVKRKWFAITVQIPRLERSFFAGTKPLRKCPVTSPQMTYSNPVNTTIHAD